MAKELFQSGVRKRWAILFRKRRLKLGLSRVAFMDSASVNYHTVSNIEAVGTIPPVEMMPGLAKGLQLSENQLYLMTGRIPEGMALPSLMEQAILDDMPGRLHPDLVDAISSAMDLPKPKQERLAEMIRGFMEVYSSK